MMHVDRYMQRNKHVAHEASFLLNGILMYWTTPKAPIGWFSRVMLSIPERCEMMRAFETEELAEVPTDV